MQNIFILLWKIFLFYYYQLIKIRWYQPPVVKTELISLSGLSIEYVEKETKKFLATYTRTETTDMNSSIQPVFYDTDSYKNAMAVANNELENYWKRRILFENTPRGNIIMHYDAYKLGFAYYSDTSGLPYSLLNAVAMKYVRIYKCRDFFIDTQITPDPSPFVKTTPPKNTTESEKTALPRSKAFAKLKTYNTVSSKVPTNDNATVFNNIMINMGKTSNFSFLQKEKKMNSLSSVYKKVSYTDYKKQYHDFVNSISDF